MKIATITVHPLEARFADLFGGIERVPASMLSPAAHFRRIKRLGQFSTLVRIASADGFSGWGEAFGLPHPGPAAALIEEVIAPALAGATVEDPAAATADLLAYFSSLGSSRGAAMEALAAVDIALWDLAARRDGVALCVKLGGAPGEVPAYVGSINFFDTVEESAAKARDFARDGYRGVKLKVGRGLDTDLPHVAAVREAIGPDVQLMLDANTGYSEAEAIAVAKAVEPYAIAWLEEPCAADDVAALARIRRASPVPIAAGENEFTVPQFRRLIEADAVDVVQPNITRAGGVSGLLAIDALCAERGLLLAPHGVGSAVGLAVAIHVLRAARSRTLYEANRLLNPLRDELAAVPTPFSQGAFTATERPGHGVEPKPELLDRYRLGTAERRLHAAE
jgi:L-alanine-DL-glutamate epimerase-like enolase superfamily enzyme